MEAEIRLQAKCFQHTWNMHPETRYCIFHVPNGGLRSKVEAMQLKASGVIAGIPDILFIWKGNLYAFEFKTLKGIVRESQKKIHEIWRKQGVPTIIIRTFEEWDTEINNILNDNK